MSKVRLIRAILLPVLLYLLVAVNGCSVFSTVGGWFSSGYENAVAYFNAYYNAKRLFDEAEAELFAAQLAAKGKSTLTGGVQPVAPPRQKFATVIDKCSNILSFYPKSNVVDDALFLIGKSFFYIDDYLKAERKFTELVAQDPQGPLALEGQLWLLRTLQMLNRYDDGSKVGQILVDAATAAEENEIVAAALVTLGDLAVAQKKYESAIEFYGRAVKEADNGELQATAQSKLGDLYFVAEEYQKASVAYNDVQKFSPDNYTLYYSQIREAISYRSLGNYDQALRILGILEADYRFFDYRGSVRLEYAQTLKLAGRFDEAGAMYQLIDSVYARSPAGVRGAFELGDILQFGKGRYAEARTAYSHALTGGDAELGREAQRRVAGLDKYFKLQSEYLRVDSILAIYDIDTAWIARDSLGRPIREDVSTAGGDSARLRQPVDSTKIADVAKKIPEQTIRASTAGEFRKIPKPVKDTLLVVRKSLSFQLGELFQMELDVPDSAFFWLNQAVRLGLDSVKAPRALFALAGIVGSNEQKMYGDPKDLYRRIVEKYPSSTYYEEARVALGFAPTVKKEDGAILVFASAESLMVARRYPEAIDSLTSIVRNYRGSPLVPKSLYTMAWIYENDLIKPDSALAKYKALATRFGTTAYGAAAIRRIPPEVPDSAKAVKRDSVMLKQPSSPAKEVDEAKRKGETPKTSGAVRDSADVQSLLRHPPSDTTKALRDTVGVEKRPAARDTVKSRRAKEEVEK